jgi:hypothetical protein
MDQISGARKAADGRSLGQRCCDSRGQWRRLVQITDSLAKPSKPVARLRELPADAVEEICFDTDQQCPIPEPRIVALRLFPSCSAFVAAL